MKDKITRLLVSSVPLSLEVEGVPKLELKLAWTMKSVIMIEGGLREAGIKLNVLQNPTYFWRDLDCTSLALALWACSSQEHPELMNLKGRDMIESYLTLDNYDAAVRGVRDAFFESLSSERRDRIKKAEAESTEEDKPPAPDPTLAPAQT